MKRTLLLFAMVGVFGTANAALLYNQPAHTPGATGGDGYSSHSGLDRWGADDFTFTGNAWSINQIDMTFVRNTGNEVITGFNVEFYTNNAGLPGTSLGGTNSTSFSLDAGAGGTYFGRPDVHALVDINTIPLEPGTYWMAAMVVSNGNIFWLTAATLTGSESAFRWPASGYPNWTSGSQTNLFGGARVDLAYSLHGSAVPEPASMAVLSLGAAALLRRRRK